MWPVITPVQPGTGLGPVQAARDETADFAYQEGVWLRALLPSLQHGADIHQHFLFCSSSSSSNIDFDVDVCFSIHYFQSKVHLPKYRFSDHEEIFLYFCKTKQSRNLI